MEEICILIFVSLLASNSLEKAESVKVKLEETQLKTFDEIFGEGWWDKSEAEDLKTQAPTNIGQNVHHQINRQNTQLGQIKPNSTDQNLPLTESDHSGQIELNSTDQNPSFTESDHSDNAKNGKEQNGKSLNENIADDERKRKIVGKFHAIKEDFKQKGKFSAKERNQIEEKIGKHLKVNRTKIYKWKKELGICGKTNGKEERKHFVEKFDQRKAELKRDGFKNSQNELDKTIAKELGLSFRTIYNWKQKFGQTITNKYSHSEQKELMEQYYKIKDKNPKISDEKIAKMLNFGRVTLFRWKRQFNRQQLHPNSVDGHYVEENVSGSNVQEFENSNLGNI